MVKYSINTTRESLRNFIPTTSSFPSKVGEAPLPPSRAKSWGLGCLTDSFSTFTPSMDLSRGTRDKSGGRTCYMKLANESLIFNDDKLIVNRVNL